MTKIKSNTVSANVVRPSPPLPLSVAEAELQNTVTVAEFAASESYGVGCSLGNARAEDWIANPNRSDSRYGGTLQGVLLDYAQRFAKAGDDVERARVEGEIVGFSYRLECPEHALALQAIAFARRGLSASNAHG